MTEDERRLKAAHEQVALARRTPYADRNEYLDAVHQVAAPILAKLEHWQRRAKHAEAVISDISEAVFGEGATTNHHALVNRIRELTKEAP